MTGLYRVNITILYKLIKMIMKLMIMIKLYTVSMIIQWKIMKWMIMIKQYKVNLNKLTVIINLT